GSEEGSGKLRRGSLRAAFPRSDSKGGCRPVKILYVYRFCGLGGVETSILNKLDALAAAGIEGYALFGEFYGSGGSRLAEDERVTLGIGKDRVRALLRKNYDAISVVDYPDFVDLLCEIGRTPPVLFETHASLPEAVARF